MILDWNKVYIEANNLSNQTEYHVYRSYTLHGCGDFIKTKRRERSTGKEPWNKKENRLSSKRPAADEVFLKSALLDQRTETHLPNKK